jgi:hypothetical protein
VVVIAGAAIAGFINHGKPRKVGSGTWDIEVDHLVYDQINASKTTKMRAEFTPVGGGRESYAVYVLDEANKVKNQRPDADPTTVQKMVNVEGTGPLTLGEMTLNAGTYYVVVENKGKSAMKVTYALYEMQGN